MCTHSPACAHRPSLGRASLAVLWPLRPAVSWAQWPCRRPSAVSCRRPGSRVVAVCRAQARPCRGLSRDTPNCSCPSLSQYTSVYCNTTSPAARLLMSRYNQLYRDPSCQALLSQYNRCIATHFPSNQLPHVAIHLLSCDTIPTHCTLYVAIHLNPSNLVLQYNPLATAAPVTIQWLYCDTLITRPNSLPAHHVTIQ